MYPIFLVKRRKREEGRGKKEEGRRKREEGRETTFKTQNSKLKNSPTPPPPLSPLSHSPTLAMSRFCKEI
ncbi:MAG: hypothetical protein HC942_11405 [Microcoleus sp. SU_5_6]|nr:hypothetical protein [Microcoleus sp. SU_5_6]